jgi:hypothetical protein
MSLTDLRFPCLHCMTPDVMAIRFDKKGRPYTACETCGTRAFLRGTLALNGIAVGSVLIPQALQQMADSPEFSTSMRTELARLQARLREVVTGPAMAPNPLAAAPAAVDAHQEIAR